MTMDDDAPLDDDDMMTTARPTARGDPPAATPTAPTAATPTAPTAATRTAPTAATRTAPTARRRRRHRRRRRATATRRHLTATPPSALDLLTGDAQTFRAKVWASRVHHHQIDPAELAAYSPSTTPTGC